jgi:hypothetical protein
LEDKRDGSGVRPIQIFGIREAVHFRATDVFGATAVDHVTKVGVIAAEVVVAGEAGGTFAAGDTGSEDDFLADADSVYFGADFGDFAGDIAAGDVREGNGNAGQSAADPEVEVVQAASMDADEDVGGAEVRFVDVGVVEDAGVAVVVEEDGFHEGLGGYIVSRYSRGGRREEVKEWKVQGCKREGTGLKTRH